MQPELICEKPIRSQFLFAKALLCRQVVRKTKEKGPPGAGPRREGAGSGGIRTLEYLEVSSDLGRVGIDRRDGQVDGVHDHGSAHRRLGGADGLDDPGYRPQS